ncbi:patatin-like phospholipase family protein [Catalinimonas niigatensis]|uniref:patatin-like phospholipase family protein n=1 Tax=Catalinimonas niigatensis TaxID=1397264 RepID=UPI002666C458|nr:patatin-like phospholipase family protein [Catalinimonas niigatensis]WPP49935.1 patatin-like phospholipase family protein [Catalinimonas niigatensis]
MKRVKEKFVDPIYYSLPVQLLVLNLRKNQLLLLGWVFLFSAITGSIGKNLGIPYLFLDPEYLGKVDFISFFIVGIAVGGLTMTYHITCYILDGNSFSFLGALSRPFAKLAINNAIVPTAFLITYMFQVVSFQLKNEYNTSWDIFVKVAGLFCGFMLMLMFLFAYFRFTNKDIFRFVASNVNRQLKRVTISRVRIMQNLNTARKNPNRVDHYLDINCKFRKAPSGSYDKELVTKVFDQNHLNSIIIEAFILLLILALGFFHDRPLFQIPAAASGVLLLTIIMMLIGAITYWLRGWATTVVIIVFFLLNAVVKNNWVSSTYMAFGLNYDVPHAPYTLEKVQSQNDSLQYVEDKAATEAILEKWKQKATLADTIEKPKMVFICTSGGGLRSALWTMSALQTADSLTQGKLFDHTQLITGASGGLVGASYFRELVLRKKLQQKKSVPKPIAQFATHQNEQHYSVYNPRYVDNLGKDNLNAIIFTLLVNDLFVRFQPFEIEGKTYIKDRGYAFEQQLNKNTEGILNKKLIDYREPEQQALIPMMLLSPAIVNDGRKLYISPQHVSYMNTGIYNNQSGHQVQVKGIDFMRFFAEQDAGSLRFLTALRMNAAFPYVTPNVSMPTEPRIQIMDAGLTDNFGVSDAVRFMYVFKDWINENTSGVVFLCVRDSEKIEPIQKPLGSSLLQRMTAPFRFLYNNLFNIQDINNDDRLEYMQNWIEVPFEQINMEYISYPSRFDKVAFTAIKERPSLSWHLTSREKDNIINNIQHPRNQEALRRLQEILN